MIKAAVKHPRALSPAEVAAWRAFCAVEPAFANPLLGPDFAGLVGEVRDDARVAILTRGKELVGFLPFHSRPGGFARPIGSTFSDYHALVTAPGERVDGAEALAAARIRAFRFNGLIDPKGAFPEARPSELEGYVITPDPSPEAYYEGLKAANPKRFKNWRRLQNKLEREWGPPVMTPDDHCLETFEQLLAWKSEQFHRTGSHDVLRPSWARELLERAFARRDGALKGVMMTLRAGDRLVAGSFGVAVGGVCHGWISVFDPDCAVAGPGQILALLTAEGLPPLGLRTYDLSPGYAHYKAPFATGTVQVAEGLAGGRAAPSLDGMLALAGADRIDALVRFRRRMDHIAAAELSVGGRVRGVVEAIAGYGRRAASREPVRTPSEAARVETAQPDMENA